MIVENENENIIVNREYLRILANSYINKWEMVKRFGITIDEYEEYKNIQPVIEMEHLPLKKKNEYRNKAYAMALEFREKLKRKPNVIYTIEV